MQTKILKLTQYGERTLGYIDQAGNVIKTVGQSSLAVGRIANDHVFRFTTHDERELGYCDRQGTIYSHGLFEGGELGWVKADGTVTQAGLILGEEEVGRVEGPQLHAAAAALLLLFLPDEAEEEKYHANR